MLIYLSVRKDGGVVALEAALDQLLCAGGVDGVLLRVHVEHVVVGEGLVLAQDHLRLSRHHVGADVTSLYLFSGQLRTNPKDKKKQHIHVGTGFQRFTGVESLRDSELLIIVFINPKPQLTAI